MPTLLETDKTVKITINSVDRSANYRTGTIHIHTTLGAEVDTCQFELEDTDGTLPAFTGWLDVLVEDETGADLFGGVIVNAIPKHQPGGDRLIWAISCVDYSALMQTKVVDGIYVGETAADILDDLFTTYLPEIDATTHVATGGTRTMRFDRVTLFDAVKMLADVDGYLWWVDASKNLHYIAPGSAAAAPFNVGDAENSDYAAIYPYLDGTLTVDYDDREIRNRVIVHGGTYASGQTTDTFSGDDTTETFTLTNRPLRSIIAVLVGGAAQAVGRDWIDNPANFDVLVNYNYGTLTWATPPPTGTDNITVIYTYDISIRVTRNDSASQTAYGRVFEFVHIDRSIGSEAQAEALADAILNAYAGRRTYGSFSVQMPGLAPGQEIEITDTAMGWSAEAFIIQSVTLTEPVVGVFELRVAFGDREPGFTAIARGFGGGAGGAAVGGAGTGGGGGGQAAYDVPASPGGLEHVNQSLGIIYVGRAQFLEIGTNFNGWNDYDTASGVVVGYDYIDDTGRILVLNSGNALVTVDNTGISIAEGDSVNNQVRWYDGSTRIGWLYGQGGTFPSEPTMRLGAEGNASIDTATVVLEVRSDDGLVAGLLSVTVQGGASYTAIRHHADTHIWENENGNELAQLVTADGLKLNVTDTASGVFHARGLSADSGVVARFTNSNFIVSTQGSSLVVGQGATTGDTYSYLQATRAGATVVTDLALNPSGGNIGLGAAAVSGMQVAIPAGSTAALNLSSTAGTAAGGILWGTDTNLYRVAAGILATSANSGSVVPTFRLVDTDTDVGNAQIIGALEFYSNDGSTGFPNVGAAVKAVSESAFGNDYGLVFYTKNTSGSLTEGGRFTAAGNLSLAQNILMGAKFIQLTEMSDPAAPAANGARLYTKDNGAGKTQLVVRFNSGAVQVIATEP
jgi:hypothetical protein